MSVKKNVVEEKSINDDNYEHLRRLFPSAVSIDDNGKYVIDPQKLQMSLDPSKANIKEDGYGLNWVGKKEAYHQAFSKNYKVLKTLNDENSKNWDDTGNILIKGDNLDALKILRQNYFESIKMIYIDPPYNTKKDTLIYNDNFTSDTNDTLEALGYDKEYIDYIENIQGAKTHSGWLSFMYPRLLLAKDLLKDDGVIFISIDNNETTQLKLLCDEIFGEKNFVESITWNKRVPKNDKGIGNIHEYILLYVKNSETKPIFTMKKDGITDIYNYIKKQKKKKATLNEAEEGLKKLYKKNGYDRGITLYNTFDQDYRLWGKINLSWPNADTFGPRYEVLHPLTKKPVNIPDRGWRWKLETFEASAKIESGKYTDIRKLDDGSVRCGNIWFASDEKTQPSSVTYLDDVNNFLLRSVLSLKSDGGIEVENIFDGKSFFSYPKPTNLLKLIINSQRFEKDDIVMDFFAGSGTTAHAMMQLNADDGGARKFIAVQWAEKTPVDSEARRSHFETVFDITQERIKRVGDLIAKGDVGFRTFEIIDDAKQHIYQMPLEKATQGDILKLLESPTIDSSEDILYNLLVAEGLPLSLSIETLVADRLYLASNVAFVLGDISIDTLIETLKDKKALEYITVYSPNISDDKLTLELENAVGSIGIKPDKLRFRG